MKSFHMKLKGGYLLNIVFLMLFSLSFVMMGCDDDDDDSAAPSGTIVTLVQENDDLSTLEAALTKFPDLVTTLSSTTAEYTVFAPNNAAFNALLSAIGQSNLNDIPEDVLRGVLEYHVIAAQKILSAQLTAGPATTANGEDITVTTAGGIKLNSSVSVSTADVNATNGVVHVIDGVLVPPSIAQFVNTVVEPAYFNKNFSTLIAAVKGASPAVLETLLNDSKKTLFAPTNEAFTAAGLSISMTTYFAWICVATIANIAAFLVSLNWRGGIIPEHVWTLIMMSAATLLAFKITSGFIVPSFSLVVIWALFGIYVRWRENDSIIIPYGALFLISLLSINVIYIIKKHRMYSRT